MKNIHEQVKRIATTKAYDYGYAIRHLETTGKIAEMLRQSDAWDSYKATLPQDLAIEVEKAYKRGYGPRV
jgi:hypothetical protein